jgi:hypothetical protein
MPADFQFVQRQLLVVITWPAIEPDIHLTRATVEAMLADPRLKRGYAVVSDWRQETALPSSEYIYQFIDLLRTAERRGITKWATVVPAASMAAYGIGRMGEAHADINHLQYRVFRDYEEAVRWAGGDEHV